MKRSYLTEYQIMNARLEDVQRLAKWCGLKDAHEYTKLRSLCNYLQYEAWVVRPPPNAWGGMY